MPCVKIHQFFAGNRGGIQKEGRRIAPLACDSENSKGKSMSGPQDAPKRRSGSKPDAEPTIGEKESRNFDQLIKDVAGGPVNRGAVINRGGLSTRAVHGGERCKGGLKARATLDALATPIVQTATFTFRNTAEIVGYNEGTYPSFEYGRYGNPTVRAAEEKIMALEGADDCVVSASGMNAVTTMLLALVDTVFLMIKSQIPQPDSPITFFARVGETVCGVAIPLGPAVR